MKIFFDTEMTGLHLNTTLISIGMVSENGRTFYAEFMDYDKSQVDKWIQEFVINNLRNPNPIGPQVSKKDNNTYVRGGTDFIKFHLLRWFEQFDEVEFINDCLGYDHALLAQLMGEKDSLQPEDNYYYPHSLCSLDKIIPIDYETLIEAKNMGEGDDHNSLHDAHVMKACYEKAMGMI